MKIHITNIYGLVRAAATSQQKTASIARNMGFNEWGLYLFDINTDTDAELGKRIDGIIASLQNGDIVFFQSPSWIGLRYDLRLMRKIKAYKDVKVVIFVHDVIPLLFNSGEDKLRATIEIYNYADLIILPSKGMQELLCKYGLTVKRQMIQTMWDCLTDFESEFPKYNKRLFFAGSPTRFPFVEKWKYTSPMVLYASERLAVDDLNIEFRDYKQNEKELLQELSEGGFGLIWSSKEENNYYKLLQPYKVATYLAAGIPVVTERGLVPEDIILENGLGFAADTLEEVNEIVQSTSEETYNRMVNRIAEFNYLVKDGWFTKKLLTDAVMMLLNDNYHD